MDTTELVQVKSARVKFIFDSVLYCFDVNNGDGDDD